MNDAVAQVRAFNRFYTQWVGALERYHLGTDFSLIEARVLYEIANAPDVLARDIGAKLGLDRGYLSRILKRFEADHLITRKESVADGRASSLRLSVEGERAFERLDSLAVARVGEALQGLSEQQQTAVTTAMGLISHRLDCDRQPLTEVTLREPQPGDFGWAVERHGVIYSTEFGWGPAFEGLVAQLFGQFASRHDPERERCWIAELGGRRAGCVFVVERERDVAQLRCLLVEPWARGHGIGANLVRACIEFARNAAYERMMLWTNRGLDAARRIYEAEGFHLIEEQEHEDFGIPLTGQNWELLL